MRIVLSNASAAWGGIHQVTEMLAAGLQQRGHRVVLLCRPGSRLEARMRGAVELRPVLRGMDLDPRALWAAVRALRGERAEVVLALTTKDVRLTGVAARVLGVPVVLRHANDRPLPGGARGRLLYGGIARHVTNAEATRRTLLASAPWLRADAVEVIRNGVDEPRIAAAAPEPLGLPAGARVVGYLGSFEPRKGLLDLAEAWPAIARGDPRAHLLLVGTGSQEPELRGRLGADPRVRFVGYRADPAPLLRALDLLVLPSYVEGAPNAVLEAMAAAVAVVATRVSGTPELVADVFTGRLVPPRDPAALAAAVGELLADDALRARMGEAGRARVRRDFSVEGMLDRYVELLAAVVASAARDT